MGRDLHGLVILAASVAGASHVRGGIPCQDAFRVHDGDHALVIAVADGLGSAAKSDLGAQAAVNAAVDRATEVAADPCRAAIEGIVAARDALEKLSFVEDVPLRDLACTLIVVVRSERIGIAHVGDGGVAGMRNGEAYLLSPPAPSEYVNEVDSLATDEWIDHIRPVVCADGLDGIAVFSDGCQHAAIRRGRAHAGFFGPLFDYVRGGVADQEELAALLSGKKMSEHSDDDKTLVLATL